MRLALVVVYLILSDRDFIWEYNLLLAFHSSLVGRRWTSLQTCPSATLWWATSLQVPFAVRNSSPARTRMVDQFTACTQSFSRPTSRLEAFLHLLLMIKMPLIKDRAKMPGTHRMTMEPPIRSNCTFVATSEELNLALRTTMTLVAAKRQLTVSRKPACRSRPISSQQNHHKRCKIKDLSRSSRCSLRSSLREPIYLIWWIWGLTIFTETRMLPMRDLSLQVVKHRTTSTQWHRTSPCNRWWALSSLNSQEPAQVAPRIRKVTNLWLGQKDRDEWPQWSLTKRTARIPIFIPLLPR